MALTLAQGQRYVDNPANADLKAFYNNPNNASVLTNPETGEKISEAEFGVRHFGNFVEKEGGETRSIFEDTDPVRFDVETGTLVSPTTGGGTTGGGTTGGGTTGGGTTGGGMMSGPVDLDPVTNLIGTPGAGQTGTQATLMGQTAGLATGQQGIRDVVDPLAGQVTTLQETVDPLASDIGTVKTDVGGIKTDVGTVKAGVGDVQSAIGTPAEGQTLLGGQQGIMSGIGTAGEGQTDLFKGQADLTAGQTGIQSAIGTADPEIEQPATLFEGQAGLAANQSGLMSGQRGITRDLTTEIGDVSSALGSQLGAFRTAAENYQRGATTQRGDIQGTQRANQANMLSQIQGVAQPINRQAEALANQRQQEAASFASSQAPLQQQIATLTANNANQAANNQPIGPLGPMAADPRDALIQQLLTRNASLMNNRPV